MREILELVTRGNVAEVKIVLASIVAALAIYQVLLMIVSYNKVRLSFLASSVASRTHRAVGDGIVVLTVLTAIVCIGYFEADESLAHVIAGTLLLLVLGLKVAVVRRWAGRDSWLPWLGATVFILFMTTWLSSAAEYVL